jgi:hypothetical protein
MNCTISMQRLKSLLLFWGITLRSLSPISPTLEPIARQCYTLTGTNSQFTPSIRSVISVSRPEEQSHVEQASGPVSG